MERTELLMRYESYSQYSKPVSIVETTMPGKGTERLLTATVSVKGIADASPTLMIGDTVLVRPMHRVSLSLPINSTGRRDWSPPIHVAELRATILSVRRGLNQSSDSVVLSWLNSRESTLFLHSLQCAAQTQPMNSKNGGNEIRFNIRFVPAVTRNTRCLTALNWLVKTYRENPNHAMELLFPVAAPVVAIPAGKIALNDISAHSNDLNDNQADFVAMVVGRTQHPSMDQIRAPMILTGPAGTGMSARRLIRVAIWVPFSQCFQVKPRRCWLRFMPFWPQARRTTFLVVYCYVPLRTRRQMSSPSDSANS